MRQGPPLTPPMLQQVGQDAHQVAEMDRRQRMREQQEILMERQRQQRAQHEALLRARHERQCSVIKQTHFIPTEHLQQDCRIPSLHAVAGDIYHFTTRHMLLQGDAAASTALETPPATPAAAVAAEARQPAGPQRRSFDITADCRAGPLQWPSGAFSNSRAIALGDASLATASGRMLQPQDVSLAVAASRSPLPPAGSPHIA